VTLFVSPDRQVGVSLEPAALRKILREAARAGRRETGGILIGHYTQWHDRATITEATPPPSDSQREATAFLRGIAGLGRLLERRWDKGLHYVGDWHFHPYAAADPSPRDIAQMRAFANDPHYQCARPVLIVIGGDPHTTWTLEVRVLGGPGPIRLTEATPGIFVSACDETPSRSGPSQSRARVSRFSS